MKYSYREYQPGDAVKINDLYKTVTGIERSVAEFSWQWLETPAGESEIWLIEATSDDGETTLIGHHGVMALSFNYFGETIRVGKTENTMVLPDFRDKIIYPRFESRFIKKYENKFHALFSTVGPEAAIRLRQAMGYRFDTAWEKLYIGREPFLSSAIIYNKLFNTANSTPPQLGSIIHNVGNAKIKAFADDIAADSFDYNNFWKRISKNYSITPNRTKGDLEWRFWNNPHKEHITLVIADDHLGKAICILSWENKFIAKIEDIFVDSLPNLGRFIGIVSRFLRQNTKVQSLSFMTTSENLEYLKGKNFRTHTWLDNLRKSPAIKRKMPRKLTTLGHSHMTHQDRWYVTPFYFEGR